MPRGGDLRRGKSFRMDKQRVDPESVNSLDPKLSRSGYLKRPYALAKMLDIYCKPFKILLAQLFFLPFHEYMPCRSGRLYAAPQFKDCGFLWNIIAHRC